MRVKLCYTVTDTSCISKMGDAKLMPKSQNIFFSLKIGVKYIVCGTFYEKNSNIYCFFYVHSILNSYCIVFIDQLIKSKFKSLHLPE